MSAGGEDFEGEVSDDIGALLDELLPADAPPEPDPNQGIAEWSVTQVGEQPARVPEPEIEQAPQFEQAQIFEQGRQFERDQQIEQAQMFEQGQQFERDQQIAPIADGEPQSSGSRVGALAFALAFALLVVVIGVVGFGFGPGQGDEVAGPGTTEASQGSGRVSTSSETTSAASPSAVESTSTVTVNAERQPPEVVAALRSQLTTVGFTSLEFSGGTDELTVDGRAAAADLAALLAAHPSIPVAFEVSTFTEATPELNQRLSSAQGTAIVSALVADGVAADRLVAVGRGGSLISDTDGNTALLYQTDDQALSDELSTINLVPRALDDDDRLTTAMESGLDKAADALARHSESTVTLLGYAYADSSETSHDRSHTVVDQAIAYLQTHGVDPDRLRTVGMGDAAMEAELAAGVDIQVGPPAAISLAFATIDTPLIGFAPGTDQLNPESLPVLSEVVTALALDPASLVEISAHTSTGGTTEANHDLSHRQGDAVAAALIEAGVAKDRLSVVGRGEDGLPATSDGLIVFRRIG